MGNLVLARKPGESIDVYDPAGECFGRIVITQGKIRGNKSSIAINAPGYLSIMRSELLVEGTSEPVSKYFALGPDPIAAIASIGFTRELKGFARGAYEHESLPIFMWNRCGWQCHMVGSNAFYVPDSLASLKDYVLQVALAEMKMAGEK
jgi:sRNA-binding carbon storage regulator CsrA